jgi:hypothetical protein
MEQNKLNFDSSFFVQEMYFAYIIVATLDLIWRMHQSI